MFVLPVWDLVASYAWDSKIFSFEWPIFDGYYPDIKFVEPLQFSLKLLTLDDGIFAEFTKLSTTIVYEWKKEVIHIASFEREWKLDYDPLNTNDINYIDKKSMTIDLSPVIREEIIMAFHTNNL